MINVEYLKINDFLFLQFIVFIALLFFFVIIPIFFFIRDKIKWDWSEKYINGYIDYLSGIKFKKVIFIFFLFISIFSILYLFWGILLSFKHQALSLKLIGIAFSGLVTLGTLLMAISSFYSIKELRNIEKKEKTCQMIKRKAEKNRQ